MRGDCTIRVSGCSNDIWQPFRPHTFPYSPASRDGWYASLLSVACICFHVQNGFLYMPAMIGRSPALAVVTTAEPHTIVNGPTSKAEWRSGPSTLEGFLGSSWLLAHFRV